MSAFCPDGCPGHDACVVGYPCPMYPASREETAEQAAQRIYNHGGYHGSPAAVEDAMRAFVNGARWATAPGPEVGFYRRPALPESNEPVAVAVEDVETDRDRAWAEFRDGPNYTPTDRYPARDAFDAGWTLAHQFHRARLSPVEPETSEPCACGHSRDSHSDGCHAGMGDHTCRCNGFRTSEPEGGESRG